MTENLLDRVVLDPNVMSGQPMIRGTGIPVELLVRRLAQGIPEGEILKEYPRLEPADIRAALTYAVEMLTREKNAAPTAEPGDEPTGCSRRREDFAALPFFGLWADREDISDSAAWIRRGREQWHQ